MGECVEECTCEELNLLRRALLVEGVSPALSLRLHHGVVIVPGAATDG
jgi:hypothetical protein